VFHRAYDLVPDPFAALEQLIDLGFTRVLTSGQRPTVLEGSAQFLALQERAAGRIQLLPGSGLKVGNLAEAKRLLRADQFHLSAFTLESDPSMGDSVIRFNSKEALEDQRRFVDIHAVKVAKEALQN
jgi:copper homeostasis protein